MLLIRVDYSIVEKSIFASRFFLTSARLTANFYSMDLCYYCVRSVMAFPSSMPCRMTRQAQQDLCFSLRFPSAWNEESRRQNVVFWGWFFGFKGGLHESKRCVKCQDHAWRILCKHKGTSSVAKSSLTRRGQCPQTPC